MIQFLERVDFNLFSNLIFHIINESTTILLYGHRRRRRRHRCSVHSFIVCQLSPYSFTIAAVRTYS